MARLKTFGASFAAGRKIHNVPAMLAAKVEIRKRVLMAIGQSARVFDAFAGGGQLYRRIWREAAGYVGCDLDWHNDGRLAYVGDNRRVLRAIDLSNFAIFDLDAFGSPWQQAWIIACRRLVKPGERVGLVLTEGSQIKLRFGSFPMALAFVAGLKGKPSGGAQLQAEILDRAIARLAGVMGCGIETRWQATGKKGSRMRYIGLVLRGLGA